MQRTLSFLLLLFLPLSVWADGMVVPTIAYPANVTIPDQRALICISNGTERLVIETRFTGAGTNFAWVVPLPSQPVIEEATTGLFPTLGYLFRTEIIHEVPHYYAGILALLVVIYLLRLAVKSVWNAFIIAIIFFLLAAMFLPALAAAKRGGREPTSSAQAVSIIDRKIVGVFETTTITSRDPKALANWLRENGFAVSTNAEPIIASYIKDGWVFVATKIRRDDAKPDTSMPHPLSFMFKTDKPVYPMRLTGLNSQSLAVGLYVFGQGRATAPHFKVESCTRPNIVHPLLRQWTSFLPVATKLTATLSPTDMRNDIWLGQTPFFFEQRSRLFSRQGALTTALNWGAELFIVCLTVCFFAFASEKRRAKLPRWIGIVTIASIALAGLSYLCLPKIEVKLVKGGFHRDHNTFLEEQFILHDALDGGGWRSIVEARAILRITISDTNNGAKIWDGTDSRYVWDNPFVGGQLHEEDSPGNYLLRETNNQLHLVFFNSDGAEDVQGTWNLPNQR